MSSKTEQKALKGAASVSGRQRRSRSYRRWVTALNGFTTSRTVIVPVIVGLLVPNVLWLNWVALVVYSLVAVSDLLDGYLARRFLIGSPLGRFLDPIADKILVVAMVYFLMALRDYHLVTKVACLVIILREVVVPGLRGYLAQAGIELEVSGAAKLKTFFQLVAIGFLIVPQVPVLTFLDLILAEWLAIFVAIFTVYSAWNYVVVAAKHFKPSSSPSAKSSSTKAKR